MSKFAEAHPDRESVQQAAAQIPWGRNVVRMNKAADAKEKSSEEIDGAATTIQASPCTTVEGYCSSDKYDTNLYYPS